MSRLTSLTGLLLLLVAPAVARAQEGGPLYRLADADARVLTAVLPAELALGDRLTARGRVASGQTEARWARIGRDATVPDPEGFVHAGTRRFALPPGARYATGCSRALSRRQLQPRAVYAIGEPAPEVDAWARAKGAGGQRQLSGEESLALLQVQGKSAAGRAFAAARRFYEARGFVLQGPVDLAATYHAGDASDRLTVLVYLYNAAAGNGVAECDPLGNTALVMLQLHDDERAPSADEQLDRTAEGQAAREAESTLDARLRDAGVDADRYHEILTAALLAATTDAATLDVVERIAAQEHDADTRQRVAVQRANVLWYRRHEAELAPLLARWRTR